MKKAAILGGAGYPTIKCTSRKRKTRFSEKRYLWVTLSIFFNKIWYTYSGILVVCSAKISLKNRIRTKVIKEILKIGLSDIWSIF